jgi:hypothetical protein
MKKSREYRFWYHYNKPMSRRMGRPILTIHWKDRCINCDKLEIHVPTETHERKRQPRMIVRGFANTVEWKPETRPRYVSGKGVYTLVVK